MGKPSKTDPHPLGDAGGAGDAHSMHSNVGANRDDALGPLGVAGASSRFRDDDDDDVPQLGPHDDDDLPPLYSDVAESNALLPPQQQQQQQRQHDGRPWIASNPLPAWDPNCTIQERANVDRNEVVIDSGLDLSPEMLEATIRDWAAIPPRLYVQVLGTHYETVEQQGKKERRSVTDFDVRLDMTAYLYRDVTAGVSWSELCTVEDYEKVKRGTVFKCRAPGFKGRVYLDERPPPTLREWVHRYCAGASSGLKAFVFRRRVVGLDREVLRKNLTQLVRSTNYRGHVNVKFIVPNETMTIFNSCRMNHWRKNKWLVFLCSITLTIIFFWPYLFFRTKRYETVFTDWPYSRGDSNDVDYISLSEQQLFDLWSQAFYQAVLSKRRCFLTQYDLVESRSPRPLPQTGNSAIDTGLGFVMAGIRAMNEVDRQLGWGYDRH